MNKTFTDEKGLTLVIQHPCCKDDDCIPMMGGDRRNPSWEEYVADYKKIYRPHLLLLRKAIEELGWVGETGESIANYYCFHFSDGVKFGFSWRAWGDLMQAIVDKREGYIKYYM